MSCSRETLSVALIVPMPSKEYQCDLNSSGTGAGSCEIKLPAGFLLCFFPIAFAKAECSDEGHLHASMSATWFCL